MEKALLRKLYIQKRSALSETEIESLSIDIANQCLQLPVWHFTNFHLFLTITGKKEINTEYLLHILQGKDKNCIVPKTNSKTETLSHYLLTDNTKIKINNWGIPEPEDGIPFPEKKIEVVFVPLLAYDKLGNRVGYGKGYYDKFLSLCNKSTVKIGLSFFKPEETEISISPIDIPLDFCVTPKEVYIF
ncbi:MAG: 5-formyltetrahydrofolate cyclo-ligase [Flavobacteriaceae bacterium]